MQPVIMTATISFIAELPASDLLFVSDHHQAGYAAATLPTPLHAQLHSVAASILAGSLWVSNSTKSLCIVHLLQMMLAGSDLIKVKLDKCNHRSQILSISTMLRMYKLHHCAATC